MNIYEVFQQLNNRQILQSITNELQNCQGKLIRIRPVNPSSATKDPERYSSPRRDMHTVCMSA